LSGAVLAQLVRVGIFRDPAPAPLPRQLITAMAEEVKTKKAEKKVVDENDEAFCGYCGIQTVDEFGILGRTLGCETKAPVRIVSAEGADPVVFEAQFLTTNQLSFLEVRNESQFFLCGQWWMDGSKRSESNTFCDLVPIKQTECHKQIDKTPDKFTAQGHCEFLRKSTSRLMQVECVTEDKKFKSKLAKVTLTMPREAWLEWKQYRVRLWKASKNTFAQDKGDDDEKKDEEKKD